MEPNLSLYSINNNQAQINAEATTKLNEALLSRQDASTSSDLIKSSTTSSLNAQQETSLHNPHDPLLPLTGLTLNHVIEPLQQLDSWLDYLFHGVWLKSGDERTSRLPLMQAGPWKLILATCFYLYLIKWLLPRLMRHRAAPFELPWIIRAYNLAMVLANMYAFYHGLRILDFGRRCFGCRRGGVDQRNKSPGEMELLHYGYLFMLSRLVEWLDTIFFCLRKRERQITKLHVFHHSFVPTLSWFYLKFYPDVTMAFFPLVNTMVHTIMYFYYFLANFGPKMQAYLWWKKYLTSLQIAQFVAILIQLASVPLSGDPACSYPRSFLLVAISGACLFLGLFYSYYRETYNTIQQRQGVDNKTHKQKLDLTTRKSAAPAARDGSSRAMSELIDDSIESSSSQSRKHQTAKVCKQL